LNSCKKQEEVRDIKKSQTQIKNSKKAAEPNCKKEQQQEKQAREKIVELVVCVWCIIVSVCMCAFASTTRDGSIVPLKRLCHG
jgi:hypothetical protein